MGWDRQPPEVVEAPAPMQAGRWLMVAVLAVMVGGLLFLLFASQRALLLKVLNIWVVSASPMLLWVFAFAARAYMYGGALSRFRFLQQEAQEAHRAWQAWAQRAMVVRASCVLLPDQVSASALLQADNSLPARTGQARRIAALPTQMDARAQAGLQLLFPALVSALHALPVEQELRVTLLSDTQPEGHGVLRKAWQRCWDGATQRPAPAVVTITHELPYQFVDQKLKTGIACFELIVVLQVHGGVSYSDGLAALLLCPDGMACVSTLPITGSLLRSMPLTIERLASELPLFLQTQAIACQATALLADGTVVQPVIAGVLAASAAHGSTLSVQQQWTLSSFCGLPGPFNSWLGAAFAVELVRHQQAPLLLLSKEQSQCWISTVTPGEIA